MAAAHWALLAVALATGAAGFTGSVTALAVFLAASIALAALELATPRTPPTSPRGLAWLLAVLGSGFGLCVWLTGVGTTREDSLWLLPSMAGAIVGAFGSPWLCSVGPQPSWREGRATPILLSWLSFALAFVV